MWRRILNRSLVQHLLAALTALSIAFLIDMGLSPYLTRTLKPVATDGLNAKAGVYLPNMGDNWNEQSVNFERMRTALGNGTLVIMGSSELSSHDLRFVPYRFFPTELGVPTLAYGHAKFQSYGIFRVLQSLSSVFTPETKLVIMLSPAWFAAEGELPSSAFAEHISGPVLSNLWDRPQARKNLIYWARHHETWGILGLLAQARLAQFRDQLQMWISGKPIVSGAAYTPTPAAIEATRNAVFPIPPALPEANWPELLAQARATGLLLSNDNPYAVRNQYYKSHLSLVEDPTHQEFARGDPLAAHEFTDLSQLMEYLQQKKVRAFFVMQPLNSKLVLDSERFIPTVRSIMAMCRRYQMSCLNLYPLRPVPGIFHDDMHLAELGWALVDQGIDKHFSK
ncbi:D-alanyl-lipoteichoic acid biosynthesis protein DltD [Paralcaligenes sp. KSB-10]|uniref:D-alanyl-lipoteichoic acid biosynthesis protein DltD n=1 Tax=Paralcaligenes sp. KSB-10 TaxID=2901142 RepID=UPI001E57AEAC|nr:D-alanyl-lipoteichoic acid biosynthesis protein DltD [Paralcaligenes sp. KSB-10]UHL65075.1 D-alanyl-lipoteichoic acid biosynthesis protein DltD [Paralcaligenes sp. KSB-10]